LSQSVRQGGDSIDFWHHFRPRLKRPVGGPGSARRAIDAVLARDLPSKPCAMSVAHDGGAADLPGTCCPTCGRPKNCTVARSRVQSVHCCRSAPDHSLALAEGGGRTRYFNPSRRSFSPDLNHPSCGGPSRRNSQSASASKVTPSCRLDDDLSCLAYTGSSCDWAAAGG
jgi:hypothetical protein